jgi:hypothetical protein
MHEGQASIVRAKDGRFFRIPEDVLREYALKPDRLSADEKGSVLETNGNGNGDARGAVQVIINISPNGHVQTETAKSEPSSAQWIYETPSSGQAMEWGDDLDPTGGMSSAARRG